MEKGGGGSVVGEGVGVGRGVVDGGCPIMITGEADLSSEWCRPTACGAYLFGGRQGRLGAYLSGQRPAGTSGSALFGPVALILMITIIIHMIIPIMITIMI